MLKASAALFGCALGAAALAAPPAAAQNYILVPQGAGSGAQGQSYLLMPAPDDPGNRAGQGRDSRSDSRQDDRSAEASRDRDPSRSLARALYRKGYERGLADAQGAAGRSLDPEEVERIGRELFDRGYLLGLMQARAEQQARDERQARDDASSDMPTAGRTAQDLSFDPLVEPGRYKAGPFTANFHEDGRFEMSRTDMKRTVKGDYSVEGASLILNDATGDVGRATFPMTCKAEPIDGGFRLTGSRDGCQELVGMEFIRREG